MSYHGRVIANYGAAAAVLGNDTGLVERAVTLSRIPLLVAGDEVVCDREAGGQLRVIDLVDRSSVLEKLDRRGIPKPLAANLTHLAIVCASKPGFDTLLVDQFCLAAHRSGVSALVVVNKADLLDEAQRLAAESWLAVYRSIGYPAVMVDTKNAGALQPLLDELPGRTVVLAGASGVGKSSIVQKLLPDLDVRVGAISAATGFGAHTTTVTCWYALPDQAALIDSPGVRQFSIAHLSQEDVRHGYLEIAGIAERCRFSNCAHVVEPGCAVRDAVSNGEIAMWRYNNYRKLAEL